VERPAAGVTAGESIFRSGGHHDSAKMMIRWGADERQWFPLEAAADYWEGEAE
jgi:hypothetical protein